MRLDKTYAQRNLQAHFWLARRIRRRLRREVPAIHRPGDGGGGDGNREHRRVVNRAELCDSMVQHWWRRMRMESGGTVLNVGSCAGSSLPGRNPFCQTFASSLQWLMVHCSG